MGLLNTIKTVSTAEKKNFKVVSLSTDGKWAKLDDGSYSATTNLRNQEGKSLIFDEVTDTVTLTAKGRSFTQPNTNAEGRAIVTRSFTDKPQQQGIMSIN